MSRFDMVCLKPLLLLPIVCVKFVMASGETIPSISAIAWSMAQDDCYHDWAHLKHDIENRKSGGDDTTVHELFSICPGSFFSLDDTQDDHWIYVTSHQQHDTPSNNDTSLQQRPQQQQLIIQCGTLGRVEDNCVIDGGLHHFWMEQGAQNVILRGLTMQHARHGSIGHACCDVQVQYENCTWRDNEYHHHFSSFHMDGNEGGGGAAINAYNADLSFRDCLFLVRASDYFLRHASFSNITNSVGTDSCTCTCLYSEIRDHGELLALGFPMYALIHVTFKTILRAKSTPHGETL